MSLTSHNPQTHKWHISKGSLKCHRRSMLIFLTAAGSICTPIRQSIYTSLSKKIMYSQVHVNVYRLVNLQTSSREMGACTGHDESVHLEMHVLWKEWLHTVVKIPLMCWSSLSADGHSTNTNKRIWKTQMVRVKVLHILVLLMPNSRLCVAGPNNSDHQIPKAELLILVYIHLWAM